MPIDHLLFCPGVITLCSVGAYVSAVYTAYRFHFVRFLSDFPCLSKFVIDWYYMKCLSRFFSPLILGPGELHMSCETPLNETHMQVRSHLQRLEKIDDFTVFPGCHVYLSSAFRPHHQKGFLLFMAR